MQDKTQELNLNQLKPHVLGVINDNPYETKRK
jgi:hypothetical protein